MPNSEFLQNIEEQMASLNREARIQNKANELIEQVKEEAWQDYYEIYGFLVKAFSKGQISIEEYREKLDQIEEISIQNNQQSLRGKLVPSYNEKAIPFVVSKHNYKKVGTIKTQSRILSRPSSIHFFKAYPDMLITVNTTVDGDRVVIREPGDISENKYYKKYDLGSCGRPIINLLRTPGGEIVVVDQRSVLIKKYVDGVWQTIKIAGIATHISGDAIHPVLGGGINAADYLPNNKLLVAVEDGNLYEFDLNEYNSKPIIYDLGLLVKDFCTTKKGTFISQTNNRLVPKIYFKAHGDKQIEPVELFDELPRSMNAGKDDDVFVSYRSQFILQEDCLGKIDGRWAVKDHRDDEQNHSSIQILPNGKRLTIRTDSMKWPLVIDSGTHWELVMEKANISTSNPRFQMLPDGRVFYLNDSNATVEIYDGEVTDD